jgi:O-antigen/teichoic acid export membrane protein
MQHLLLGVAQLILALAAVLSIVLAGTTDLDAVTPFTWLLIAALVVVSIVRLGLYFARGRPSTRWLEPDE